jgi:hypothetical protein
MGPEHTAPPLDDDDDGYELIYLLCSFCYEYNEFIYVSPNINKR